MDADILKRHFGRMGARVAVNNTPRRTIGLDVRRDNRGEFFEITVGAGREVSVIDVRPKDRHLLVLAREPVSNVKDKFLCGHDERAWFVAAVPDDRGVSDVRSAMEALKPTDVRQAQERLGVPRKARTRRRTDAYSRQGEWFFIPAPHMAFDRSLIFRNEPLRRGGGKPHIVDQAVRTAGELVYVSRLAPQGLTQAEYKRRIANDRDARKVHWQPMRRDAEVYVRGRVRHADHATITLPFWHLVRMNTETRSRAMQHVRFLD